MKIQKLWILFAILIALFFFSLSRPLLAIDATFTVSILAPAELPEGQKNFIFVIRRTGNPGNVTVFYKMSGTATVGNDYTAPPGSAQFLQGQDTVNVSIPTVNDTLPENDETVILTVISPPIAGAYLIGSPAAATATIKDDEPIVTITTLPGTPFESAGSISLDPIGFQLSRTGPNVIPLQVDLRISGSAINGTDYNQIVNQLLIEASQKKITLAVKDDLIIDPDETVTITVLPNNQRYKVGTPSSATLKILDNDPPVISLSVSDDTAEEGNSSTATVKIDRTGDAQQDITVNYTVNPANAVIVGTPATSGTDFVALSGSIVVPRFRNFANIVITPVDDSLIEGTEKVLIHLAPSSVYKLGVSQNQTISILDDDRAVVTVTPTDGIASESGPDAGTFTFSRTGDTTSALTVRFTIATGGTNQATLNTDFSLPPRILNNSVSFPAGQNSVDIVITPIDDSQQEPQEQVTISIAPDAAYTVGSNSTATIFIADND